MNTMKHPTDAEWMEALYGEVSSEVRAEREAHRKGCVRCQERVAEWRAAMEGLDADMEAGSKEAAGGAMGGANSARPRHDSGVLRFPGQGWWAIAAALVAIFAGGYALGGRGRIGVAEVDRRVSEAVTRAVGEAETRWKREQAAAVERAVGGAVERVTQEYQLRLDEVVTRLDEARLAEHREWLAAAVEAEERHAREVFQLRAGISALAQHAGVGLQKAASQIHLLASYLPASETGDSMRGNSIDGVSVGGNRKE